MRPQASMCSYGYDLFPGFNQMAYIAAGTTKHTSLDLTTVSGLSLCGGSGVLPDAIGTVYVYTLRCVPHLTARYLHVYQIQSSMLHVLELEPNVGGTAHPQILQPASLPSTTP